MCVWGHVAVAHAGVWVHVAVARVRVMRNLCAPVVCMSLSLEFCDSVLSEIGCLVKDTCDSVLYVWAYVCGPAFLPLGEDALLEDFAQNFA